MRKFLTFCAAFVAASLFLLPGAAQAQKALVYCPPTDNATCATLVTTLSATGGYPGGVDRAYDGTAGSVDLKTADLFAYTVFFIPSLSDGEAGTPYALLRDPTVAERLRAALIGRRAFWSGTPDLGASNRDKKNALIANLASWAGAKFATVQGPGLVVLQDNSDNDAAQYNWVNGLLGVTITSDHTPMSYDSVRTISAAGVAIVTSNAASLAYPNMASYGFALPNGAPGISLDAVGQTGTTVGGEVVLLTSDGANTGGATIKTDKNDYAPGTTVVMTGAGFGAGETVTLTLHEDPLVHEDRSFTATADGNGAFTFSGFAPEQHHIGVRFVLTAVGQASGKRAQTTFTDGDASAGDGTMVVNPTSVVGGSTGNTLVFTFKTQNGKDYFVRTTPTPALRPLLRLVIPAGWTAPTASNVTVAPTAANGCSEADLVGITGTGPWTVTVNIACEGTSGQDKSTFTITYSGVTAPTAAGTTTFTTSTRTLTSGAFTALKVADQPKVTVTAATTRPTTTVVARTAGTTTPSVYGSAVSFTATVTAAAGNPSGVGTVTFKDGTTVLCLDVALSGNTAVCSPTSDKFPAGNRTITAVYSGTTTGSPRFDGSTSADLLHVVNRAPLTVTVTSFSKLFNQPNPALTGTVVGVVSGDVITASYSTTATQTSPVGSYSITATILDAGGKIGNYDVTNSPGTLTINKASQTITFLQPAGLTYGGDALQVSGTATSDLLVTFMASGACSVGSGGAANMVSPTSAGSCIVTATQPGNANYDAATPVSYTIEVAKKSLTGTITAADKVYDGNTTAVVTPLPLTGVLSGDVVSLSASGTFASQNFGTHAVTANLSLSGAAAGNYAVNPTATATAKILKRAVTATADAKSKAYGDEDPALSYQLSVGSLVPGESFSGALARAAGESVGTWAITQGTLALSTNYELTYVPADLTITQRAITVTAAAKSKIYGESDPALTYAVTVGSLVGTDALTGTLDRAAGETVAGSPYAIAKGTVTAGDNYALTFVPANLTITPKALTVATLTAASKVYDGLTSTTGGGTLGGVIAPDNVTLVVGSASFADKNVGPAKTVNLSGIALGGADKSNYSLAQTTGEATAAITERPITVTAEAKSKTYGDADPEFTFGPTPSGLVAGDSFTGALSRAPGQTVGAYDILQGSLTAGGNYTIAYQSAQLTITRKAASVTVNAATKIYGSLDPALSGTLSGFLATDNVTATYTRATGETVLGSPYTISATLEPAGVLGNYEIASTTAAFTITRKELTTATIVAANKQYDGTTTASITGTTLPGKVGDDAVTLTVGSASFADKHAGTGKTVTGTALSLTGAAAGNYTFTPTSITTTADITKRAITVAADAQTKVYGDADPALTYKVTSETKLADGDTFTGMLDRVDGENVVAAGYAIERGALTIADGATPAGGNYDLTFNGNTLQITPRAITVTAAAKSKTYGDADPALTYAITTGNLVFNDAFTGDLTRAGGQTVGGSPYAIQQGTLSAGTNYSLTYVGAGLTITRKTIAPGTLTVAHKVYDATTAATITSRPLAAGAVVGSDDVALTDGTATFDNANVGAGKPVSITGLTLSGTTADNYTLSPTTASTTADISARPISITADAGTKVYGDAEPALTYQITAGTLAGTDTFTGLLDRVDGENVGPYAIERGAVTAGSNYALTYVPSTFTITQRPISVTAAAKTKIYGDVDPALTYALTAGNLVGTDALSGALGRATGESVAGSPYAILQGSVTAGGNYNLSYVGAALTITPKTIAPGALTVADKVYDATTAATILTRPLATGSAVSGDDVALTGGTAVFTENANVGTAKPVGISGLTLTGTTAGNYTLSPTTAAATASITVRPVTITAAGKSKTYGDADPALTYAITEGTLAGSDAFTGSLIRGGTQDVGTYPILQGDVTLGTNYLLAYVGADFTITKRPVTITAAAKTKIQGGVDPALTYAISSGTLAYSDAFIGTLTRAAGETVGTYAIGQGTVALTANYTLGYVGANLTITENKKPILGTVNLSANGQPVVGPLPKGTVVTLTSSFTDADEPESTPYFVTVNWDDGSPVETVTATRTGLGQYSISRTHTFAEAVVSTIEVKVTDKINTVAVGSMIGYASTYTVIYDPSAGFVTGGGWIDSPTGACTLNAGCETLTGKANFGFVAKYKKGSNVPDGNTEFQFKAGGVDFKSTAYQWLVVAGSKAQYKGTGTLNGTGNYTFLITAIDGDAKTTGKGPDAFRIKITSASGVTVYDNKRGVAEDSDAATLLGGGSIQIHDR